LRSVDCRYIGQGYELRVDFPTGLVDKQSVELVSEEFHKNHESEYGHSFYENPIEIVNIRVTGLGSMPKIKKQKVNHPYLLEEALLKTGETIFNINGTLEKVVTKFYQREQIPVGVKFQGPCIVLQKDTTTVIPPNCTAFIEEFGNMIIKVGV